MRRRLERFGLVAATALVAVSATAYASRGNSQTGFVDYAYWRNILHPVPMKYDVGLALRCIDLEVGAASWSAVEVRALLLRSRRAMGAAD
jgi:hypothetical protein